jgi:hypothetical protein
MLRGMRAGRFMGPARPAGWAGRSRRGAGPVVDLTAGVVDVAETTNELKGKLVFGPPKTKASRRKVSLPPGVVEELAEHMRFPGRPTDFVFKAPGGGTLRTSNFRQNFWRPAVVAANLDGLRIHDLRHTAVALWIAAGASPKEPPPAPGTPRSASCWIATATCSPRRTRRFVADWMTYFDGPCSDPALVPCWCGIDRADA